MDVAPDDCVKNLWFLPPLKRQKQPGTNKPLYLWDETDIDQIVIVYDPLELLRLTSLRPVEKYFQRLTAGETDVEEISIAVSSIALMFINKLQFTPSLVTQRKKVDVAEMKLFIQILLDILSDLEPDPEMLHSTFLANDEEDFAFAQNIIKVVRDILSLPHLREVIRTTTLERWQQAREDFLSICNVFGIIEDSRINNGGELIPEDFLMGLKITGAYWLTAPLLSKRYRGYGHWIDIAYENIYEFLADPAVQEMILNKQRARRTIEADIENSEKPELSISE